MTGDLFASDDARCFIDLPGAEVRFESHFLAQSLADEHLHGLFEETPWREENVFVWGKWHKQPRMIAWYGDEGASYSYSGSVLAPLQWTVRLTQLREMVSAHCSADFNSVLLNLYRDGNDSMGWHSDNETELGVRPVIGSLSLGATRELLFKHRENKSLGTRRIPLTHGSLLVMAGDTQNNWMHSIQKDSHEKQRRINLTFRYIFTRSRNLRKETD